MRRVIVDEIRHVVAQKRKADLVELPEQGLADDSQTRSEFLLQVDEALSALEEKDPRLARTFECRYFGGYSTTETAEIVGVSIRTVERLWSQARTQMAELIGDA